MVPLSTHTIIVANMLWALINTQRGVSFFITFQIVCVVQTAQHVGYRTLWHTLRSSYGLCIGQNSLRQYLRCRDPASVDLRSRRRLHRRTYISRGPNDCWHLDGYDKLKRYGIAVSGCIDGFSRRVIWLRCSCSNNKPEIIAHYYLEAVQSLMLCPRRLRSDRGSENSATAALQCCLTGDGNSHLYGTSPANQRIESFWALFRRQRTQWWIDLFEDMISADVLNISNEKDVELIRFCFMNIIQNDLVIYQNLWNTHRIRPSAGSRCPSGIPEELFYFPPGDAVDCSVAVDPVTVINYMPFVHYPDRCANASFEDYLMYLKSFLNLSSVNTWRDAVALFMTLRSKL